MALTTRVGQHLSVMFTEAGQQLFFIEAVEFAEREQPARALVLVRCIVENVVAEPVVESGRREIIVGFDDGQGLLEHQGVVPAEAGDKIVQRNL